MMNGSFFSKIALLILVAITVSGCVVQQPPRPNDPYYAPVYQPSTTADKPVNGSLYRENIALNLFGDRKATRVGDIISILLDERTQSSKSANTQIRKENEITGPDAGGNIFGSTPSARGLTLGMDITTDREFRGESLADQQNQLVGNISVTVTDIYPNGTLVVRGEKWITLNHGEEFIRVSGLVRPDDVTPENTVLSTKIANARIQYSGTGQVAESQQMGWFTRFFNGPLWPF